MCLGPCVDILSSQREHVDHLQCSQNHIWRIFPFRLFRDFPLSLELTLKHSGTRLDDTILTAIDLTVFLVMCQYDSNYCAITFHGRCGNGPVWNDLALPMRLMKKMTWVMMMTSGLADLTPHPRQTLTLLNLIFLLLFLHFCIKLLQEKPPDCTNSFVSVFHRASPPAPIPPSLPACISLLAADPRLACWSCASLSLLL